MSLVFEFANHIGCYCNAEFANPIFEDAFSRRVVRRRRMMFLVV
jgi:hypothetical protein